LASFTKNRPRRIQPNLGPRKATPATKACYEPAASIAACLSMKQTNDDVQTGQSARGLALELAAED
jgi:hypothetical protein